MVGIELAEPNLCSGPAIQLDVAEQDTRGIRAAGAYRGRATRWIEPGVLGIEQHAEQLVFGVRDQGRCPDIPRSEHAVLRHVCRESEVRVTLPAAPREERAG